MLFGVMMFSSSKEEFFFCSIFLALFFFASTAFAVEIPTIPFDYLSDDDNFSALLLDEFPSSERSFAILADWEMSGDDSASAISIWRSLLRSDNYEMRNWAALWLGIIDTALAENFPEDVPWGIFWSAIKNRYKTPYNSLGMLKTLQGDTIPDVLILLAQYWRGLIFADLKRADSALAQWNEILKNYPMNILSGEIYYRSGLLHFLGGEYTSAESSFAQALDFYKVSSRKSVHWWADEAAYLKMLSFLREEKFDSAEAELSHLERISPQSKYISTAEAILSAYRDNSAVFGDEIPSSFRADLMMKNGWAMFDAKKYRQAYIYFLDAYNAQNSQDALLMAAECAYNSKDYFTADSLYNLITDLELKKYAVWGRGWCQTRMKKYGLARQLWESLLGDSTFEDDVSFAIARSYYFQWSLNDAIENLGEYLSKHRKHRRQAMALLFFAQINAGDTATAIETAKKYLDKYPSGRTSEQIALSVANAMFARKNYSALLNWVDMTDKNFSGTILDSLVLLSERAKYHLGDYDDPLEILNGMFERRGESPLAISLALDMGNELLASNRWNDAIYAYSKAQAVSLPGDSEWCEATLGILRAQFGIGDTISAFLTLNDLVSDGEQPWIARGQIFVGNWIWKNIGDMERALMLYQNARRDAKSSAVMDSAVLAIGKLYFSAMMFSEAAASVSERWKTLEKSSPVSYDYAMLIAQSIWEEGLQDSAVFFAVAIADSIFGGCDYLVSVGKMALSQGRPELSEKVMDKIKEVGCQDVPASFLLQMGDAMVQLERISDACSLFALVAEQHPDDSLGETARKRLKIFSIKEDKK